MLAEQQQDWPSELPAALPALTRLTFLDVLLHSIDAQNPQRSERDLFLSMQEFGQLKLLRLQLLNSGTLSMAPLACLPALEQLDFHAVAALDDAALSWVLRQPRLSLWSMSGGAVASSTAKRRFLDSLPAHVRLTVAKFIVVQQFVA